MHFLEHHKFTCSHFLRNVIFCVNYVKFMFMVRKEFMRCYSGFCLSYGMAWSKLLEPYLAMEHGLISRLWLRTPASTLRLAFLQRSASGTVLPAA